MFTDRTIVSWICRLQHHNQSSHGKLQSSSQNWHHHRECDFINHRRETKQEYEYDLPIRYIVLWELYIRRAFIVSHETKKISHPLRDAPLLYDPIFSPHLIDHGNRKKWEKEKGTTDRRIANKKCAAIDKFCTFVENFRVFLETHSRIHTLKAGHHSKPTRTLLSFRGCKWNEQKSRKKLSSLRHRN